jgi:beta-ribofuranosylaminobenzene 5'-phosphate synthase
MTRADRIVEVAVPSRLHFGMFSFGDPRVRQFGGVGVMIDQPGLKLRAVAAQRNEAQGPLADRVLAVVDRVSSNWRDGDPPRCQIEVLSAPEQHIGLGSGTQLALSVAAAMRALASRQPASPAELAALTGRAQRSAIGTYGFAQGGLLVDAGKLAGEPLAPLEAHAELPAEWRFVLTWPRGQRGLSGDAERAAFQKLPAVSAETTARLRTIVHNELLPAAVAGDFTQFGESLYRFGHAAGECFAAGQGGVYADTRIAQLVAAIRQLGVRGVGQSSWGPAVFALASDHDAGVALVEHLRRIAGAGYEFIIAQPNRTGVRITRGQS